MNTEFIHSNEALIAFCERVKNLEWLGLDTEFVRRRTYFAKLALIQISAMVEGEEAIACVDPLANLDLKPLRDLLNNTNTLFLLHSATQDLEVLHQAGVGLPTRLFDTQVAAALLGYGDQISYAELVAQIAGVVLTKAQTQTDWSKRPLTAAQFDYAADDVRYLHNIYQKLNQQLTELKREQWLHEEIGRLLHIDNYEPNARNAWKRLGKGQRLNTPAQHRLKALSILREQTAMRKNLPRKWVVDDDTLIAIAESNATSAKDIARINPKVNGYLLREMAELNQIELENDTKPVWSPASAFTPEQKKLLKKLMQQCHEKADELNISSSLMASRSAVEALFRGQADGRLTVGWRKEVIGDALLTTIAESARQPP